MTAVSAAGYSSSLTRGEFVGASTQHYNLSCNYSYSEVILIATWLYFSEFFAISYCSNVNVILRKSFGKKMSPKYYVAV